MSTNTEALASNTYNPDIDDRTLSLYQMMTNRQQDDSLLETYRNMVLNYPTANLYEGVLVNPRACEIDANTSLVEEIITKLQEQYQGIVNQGTPTTGGSTQTVADPTLPPRGPGGDTPTDVDYPIGPGGVPVTGNYMPSDVQVRTLAEWLAAYPQMQADLNQVQQTLNFYKDHTDRLVGNFGTFSNLAQTSIGNTVATNAATSSSSGSSTPPIDLSGLGNLGGSAGGLGNNPCIGFGDIFGSLFAAGQKMLDQLSKSLMGLLGMIGNPMALIQQALGAVMGMVNQIMSKIMGELNKLAASIMNMMRMGLAQLMAFMPSDPCMKNIIGGLLSAGAKSVMGGIL